MRFSQKEKYEIIRIVEDSEIGPSRTLRELGINKSTFYNWYGRYKESGYDGLAPKQRSRNSYWNKIPDAVKGQVVELALELPALSPRELACTLIDTQGYFISESSVYRILKAHGLITSPAYIMMQASDEFKDKTTGIHQMWQTDFTYFKIIGWGWYYLSTIMDDYSRYIIHWELCSSMKAADAQRSVEAALQKANLTENQVPRLLSDNGSCYISNELKDYLEDKQILHVRGKPNHPQTQGKIERYHRSMKNVVKLDNYYSPGELKHKLEEFVNYYNHHRYHESLNNLTPHDVYTGRARELLEKRRKTKRRTMNERRRHHLLLMSNL